MLLICFVAFIASGLTLFSGFGLGTLLMPAFAIFFPVPTAIALTAIVHLLNNLFKLALLVRHVNFPVAWRFGLPALVFAMLGAWLLGQLSHAGPLFQYDAFGRHAAVLPANLIIAMLMLVFAYLEATSLADRWAIPRRWLPVGGAIGGFFGGLSGHQGALRSAFLIRTGLGKEGFIATGVVIGCAVDVARLSVYATSLDWTMARANGWLVAAATLSAFAGAFLGTRLITKVTMRQVQVTVAAMLALAALGLASGLI